MNTFSRIFLILFFFVAAFSIKAQGDCPTASGASSGSITISGSCSVPNNVIYQVNGDLILNGNLTLGSGAKLIVTGSITNSYIGSAATYTISGGTVEAANVNTGNNYTLALSGTNVTLSGDYTGGWLGGLSLANSTLDIGGQFSEGFASGSTLSLDNSDISTGTSFSLGGSKNLSLINGSSISTGTTFTYNGGSGTTLTVDNSSITSVGNTSIAASSTVNITDSSEIEVGGVLSFGSSVNLSVEDSEIDVTSNLSFGDNVIVDFDSSQIVVGGNYSNGNSATLTMSASNLTITGSTTINQNSTYTISSNSAVSSGGAFTTRGGVSLNFDNSDLIVTTGGISTGQSSTTTFTNGSDAEIKAGTFQTGNSSTLTIDASEVHVYEDLNNDFTATINVQNNGVLRIDGDFNNGYTVDKSVTQGYVNVDNGKIIIGGDLNNDYDSDIIVDGGGSVAVTGGINNDQAATINVVDGTLSYSGSLDDPYNGVSTGSGSADTECTDGCCGTGCAALPVELLSYTAKELEGIVTLSWATATEIDNDFFTIEKSLDGKTFTEIAEIDGAGTSKTKLAYEYEDELKASGTVYYRLSQTDFDGTTVILGIKVLNVANFKQQFSFYPNPVASGAKINFGNVLPEQVIIYNQIGQIVFETMVTSDQLQLPADLDHGFYIIKAKIGNTFTASKLNIK